MKKPVLAWICFFFIGTIFALLLSPFLCSVSAAENNNLVLNAGFEESEGNDPYYWTGGSWENRGSLQIDRTQAHSGKASALITNETATDTRFKQQIRVRSNAFYRLSCWVRTENIGPDGKGANLSIEGLIDTSSDIKGTSGDWTYIELYGISGKDQKSFVLTIGLGGYSNISTGKAWFDDVTVEELSSAPERGNVVKLYRETEKGASGSTAGKSGFGVGLAVLLAVAALVTILVWFIMRGPTKRKQTNPSTGSVDSQNRSSIPAGSAESPPLPSTLEKRDWLVMGIMTFAYLLIAVLNLGSFKAPLTSWTPAAQGESILVDFGREIHAGPIYFYSGLGHKRPDSGKYRVQYLESPGVYRPLATIEKNEGKIFLWQYVNSPDIKTRYMKVIVDAPGGTLNEIAFFEKGEKVPLKGIQLLEKNTSPDDEGKVENLFDEPGTVDYNHTYLSGMIFDEIYHARTAYEFLNGMEPYEWTHPPLGKLLISVGILVFGMVPFGWRIVGTLFGVAMVPVMYLFGRKLFGGRFYGVCTAFLTMFDFMHFGLTRIATIDVYGTFFIILMYYYMYDYFTKKSYETGFRQSLKPLFLCGLCFGLGSASKWIGLYAGGGLALLFFLAKYREYREYARLNAQKGKRPAWLDDFLPLYLGRTCLYCIVFFVIIPGTIYMLSYIPYILTPGHDFGVIFSNQAAMLKYHSKDVLNATHAYASRWWQWPTMLRPLLTYYGTDLPAGMSSSMTIMGNPAIWWFGIAAVAASILRAVRKRDRRMLVVFVAIAFQYLPWVGITRIAFIYHFFSSVPFVILCIVYILKAFLEESRHEMKFVVYGYLALVFLLFVLFYPVLSGLETPRSYVTDYLLWFRNLWVF